MACVSPRHFSRSFRRAFGETPHQYLRSRRLERARYLLRASDLSVLEVCLAVGFASVGSFTTAFSRHVGVSPTTYRELNRAAVKGERGRIPLCAIKAWTRLPTDGTFREDGRQAPD